MSADDQLVRSTIFHAALFWSRQDGQGCCKQEGCTQPTRWTQAVKAVLYSDMAEHL